VSILVVTAMAGPVAQEHGGWYVDPTAGIGAVVEPSASGGLAVTAYRAEDTSESMCVDRSGELRCDGLVAWRTTLRAEPDGNLLVRTTGAPDVRFRRLRERYQAVEDGLLVDLAVLPVGGGTYRLWRTAWRPVAAIDLSPGADGWYRGEYAGGSVRARPRQDRWETVVTAGGGERRVTLTYPAVVSPPFREGAARRLQFPDLRSAAAGTPCAAGNRHAEAIGPVPLGVSVTRTSVQGGVAVALAPGGAWTVVRTASGRYALRRSGVDPSIDPGIDLGPVSREDSFRWAPSGERLLWVAPGDGGGTVTATVFDGGLPTASREVATGRAAAWVNDRQIVVLDRDTLFLVAIDAVGGAPEPPALPLVGGADLATARSASYDAATGRVVTEPPPRVTAPGDTAPHAIGDGTDGAAPARPVPTGGLAGVLNTTPSPDGAILAILHRDHLTGRPVVSLQKLTDGRPVGPPTTVLRPAAVGASAAVGAPAAGPLIWTGPRTLAVLTAGGAEIDTITFRW